jgi:hypothetical protein
VHAEAYDPTVSTPTATASGRGGRADALLHSYEDEEYALGEGDRAAPNTRRRNGMGSGSLGRAETEMAPLLDLANDGSGGVGGSNSRRSPLRSQPSAKERS